MCLHPRYLKVYNKLSRSIESIPIDCGHCDECLKKYQNGWFVRLHSELVESSTPIIFDTLTFDEDHIPRLRIDYNDCVDHDTGELLISPSSLSYLEQCNWNPTFADSELVRDHFKSGRESYFYRYKERCPMKYFIVGEYGSTTGRFHIHLLAWNISFLDYQRFFGRPWQDKYGFHKVKTCALSNRVKLSSFIRYVTKYCAKGSFDNPLVLDGVFPKPFKLCSNGIGMAYVRKYKSWHTNGFDMDLQYKASLKDCPSDCPPEDFALVNGIPLAKAVKALHNAPSDLFSVVLSRYLITLNNGSRSLNYSMPKYIKDKIFGVQTPFSFALANYLRDFSVDIYRKKVESFARSHTHCSFRLDWSLPFCGLSPFDYSCLVSAFTDSEKREKLVKAKTFRDRLKRTYKRSFC